MFDELPDNKKTNSKFKAYLIRNLKSANKINNKIYTGRRFVEEVDSKKHPVLQCIDVITGVIESHLNNDGTTSKRQQAREKVYNFILEQVAEIHENFVVTETTSPIYSVNGFYDKYKHFVYKKKKVPGVST